MKYKHGLHFDYPNDIHAHMIDPEQVRDDKLDENYPYYDKSKWLIFKQVLIQFLLRVIVFPVNYFRYGCKVIGRKNLKKYKKDLRNGFFTVANHVFEWDYICVRSAMRFKRGYVTIWKRNHNSSLGKLMRTVGSIPIPDKTNLHAIVAFNNAIKECLDDGNMIHFYPEGSMWYFYQGLREFFPGVFHYAVSYNRPVVPLSLAFRPPKGIFKLWKRHGAPCVTIEVGEPLYPNLELNKKSAIEDISNKAFNFIKDAMDRNTPDID